MKRALSALLASCVALAGEAAAGDVTIVSTTTTGGGSATVTEYLTAASARSSDGASEAIVDTARDRVVVVDHARKEYWETSRGGLAAALAEEPPSPAPGGDGKTKSLGLLDARGASLETVTLERGKAPRRVAGHPCEHWVIAMGETLRVDLWAARDLAAPPAYFDALRARHATMGPLGRRLDRLVEEMRKVGGLPLAQRTTVRVMGAEQETRQEATVVRLDPIPAAAFEVPKGYVRRGTPPAP